MKILAFKVDKIKGFAVRNVLILAILLSCISLPAQAARTINGALLNGQSSVTVEAGATVTVTIMVTTTGNGNNKHWKSTSYSLSPGSSNICVNTSNVTSSGTHTNSFNISAPSNIGSYDISFRAHRKDSCDNGSASTEFTLDDGIIVSTGAAPDISVDNINVDAGDNANFIVNLTNQYSEDITLNYSTSDGTATDGEDYTGASGTVTVLEGDVTATVSIATLPLGDGNFTLTLSNASAGTITDATARATIIKATGLVVDYHFDECRYTGANGEVIDHTGFYNGTTHDVPNPINDAVINKSVDLTATGEDDWISVPSGVVDGLDDFTLSFWVNTSEDKSQQEVFHALGADEDDDELEVYLSDDDEVYIKVRDSSETLESDEDITDGDWHHIALTRVDEDVCLYVDGIEQDCGDDVNEGVLSVPYSNAIVIGQEQDDFGGDFSSSQSYEGQLEEFQIYDGLLSSGEIAAIYINQKAGRNSDGSSRDAVDCRLAPITEYRFDEEEYSDTANEIIDSISDFHGRAKDSQPTENGKVCNAINLEKTGTTNYAILGEEALTGKTDFTISLWAKTEKTSNQSIISGAGDTNNELIMWFRDHTRFRPYLNNSHDGDIGIDSIADDNWQHLVWTREGSQSCLYQNKALQGCIEQSDGSLGIESLILGQEQDSIGGGFSSAQAFDGLIDELLIFDGAISLEQISDIYDNQNAGLGYDGSARDCPTLSPPVLDMRFDEVDWSDADSVLDSSGNDYHANAVNVTPTEGFICNAANLNEEGVDDYITLDSQTLHGRSNFTVSVWYKTPKLGSQSLLSGAHSGADNELIFWFDNATSFVPHLKNISGSGISTTSIAGNEWHHLVWTRSGTENLFYHDGVLQAGSSSLSSAALNITHLILGQEQDVIGGNFQDFQAAEGILDELLVFKRAISAAEVDTIFTNQTNGFNYDGSTRADCLPLLDHFEIIHDGQGLTCDAETITIKACADASCTTLNHDATDVQLFVNGTLSKTVTVVGSTDTNFAFTTPGTATLSLDQGYQCKNGTSDSCDVVFADTGLRFYSGIAGNPIPEQLSAKPSNTGYNASTLKIQTIEKNPDSGACQGAFIDSNTIEMLATCVDPDECAGSKVSINNLSTDTPINTLNNAASKTYTNVELNFSNETTNTAEFVFTYPDAGQVQLHARYNIRDENGIPTGNYMSGSSTAFVVRPLGFYIDVDGNPKAQSAIAPNNGVFIAAGEDFTTSLSAVQWQAADDNNDDGIPDEGANLSNNTVTVNFGNESTLQTATITDSLYLPNPGTLGELTNDTFTNFNNGVATNGVDNDKSMTYSEVGIISFTANLTSYLGASGITGAEPYVGRFIPHHFELTGLDGELTSICEITTPSSEMAFAYVGQMSNGSSTKGALQFKLLPEVTITPQAKPTSPGDPASHTQNYTGDFNKLLLSGVVRFKVDDGDGNMVLAPIEDFTQDGVDEDKKVKLTANLVDGTLLEADGILSFEYSMDDNFIYTHEENSEIIPFVSDINLSIASIIDEDGVVAKDIDGNGDTGVATDTVITLHPTGTEIRFGRLYLANSFGPETSNLPQHFSVQYLKTAGNYVVNAEDTCTDFNASQITLTSGTLNKNKTSAITAQGYFDDELPNGETRAMELEAPGAGDQGTILVEYEIYDWLKYDWTWNGVAAKEFDENPTAIATFGLFRGNDRIIYQREVNN